MAPAKTVTLTYCIEPGMKGALHAVNVTPKAIVPAQFERKKYFSSHVL